MGTKTNRTYFVMSKRILPMMKQNAYSGFLDMESNKGATSGSRVEFRTERKAPFILHKPHPEKQRNLLIKEPLTYKEKTI